MEESLTELSELVGTAGLEVAGSTYQKVRRLSRKRRKCVCRSLFLLWRVRWHAVHHLSPL